MSFLSKETDLLVRPKIAKLKCAWNQITEMYKSHELRFPDRYYSLDKQAQDGYEIRKACISDIRLPRCGDMYCTVLILLQAIRYKKTEKLFYDAICQI